MSDKETTHPIIERFVNQQCVNTLPSGATIWSALAYVRGSDHPVRLRGYAPPPELISVATDNLPPLRIQRVEWSLA